LALSRQGEAKLQELKDFCVRSAIDVIPFGADQVDLAIDAFRRCSKGRRPAGLTFGDGSAYALAKATGAPLLFKGDDFSQIDIKRAV
jgi:ribonuclease VapC